MSRSIHTTKKDLKRERYFSHADDVPRGGDATELERADINKSLGNSTDSKAPGKETECSGARSLETWETRSRAKDEKAQGGHFLEGKFRKMTTQTSNQTMQRTASSPRRVFDKAAMTCKCLPSTLWLAWPLAADSRSLILCLVRCYAP